MPFEHVCAVCGTHFTNQAREASFCKRSCFHASLRTLKPIECSECGIEFRPIESKQRLCSQSCKSRMQSRLFANRVPITCGHCGKQFGQKPCLVGTSRFCSRPCKHAAKVAEGHITAACKACGKTFERLRSRVGDFCSHTCRAIIAKQTRVDLVCPVCKITFEVIRSQGWWRITCSRKCGRIHWATVIQPLGGQNAATRPERLTENALIELGLHYIPQHPMFGFLIDFYLPDHKIALEVDGVYWHSLPVTINRDARKNQVLTTAGLTVVRIPDTEILQAKDLPQLIREKAMI